MKKTNKEVIDELVKYFMKQPQEHTCKMLACMMIDLNRIVNYQSLQKGELHNLQCRINWNISELNKFIKDGPTGELKLETYNS